MTQLDKRLFGCALQLLGQGEQLGYTDTLNDADIHLPGQHLSAMIFQQLLEFMHEHNEIQRIQPRFDEVVRFTACEVVSSLQFSERPFHLGTGRGTASILLSRKVGENGKFTGVPHLFRLVAHDLAGTGPRYGTWRDERNYR